MELHRQQSPSLSSEVLAAGRGLRGRESLATLLVPSSLPRPAPLPGRHRDGAGCVCILKE